MALVRRQLDKDVVSAARERIETVFSNGVPVYLAMSGGKDSISLASVVYDLIQEGRIDPALLTVNFIDEEAVFDDIERIVRGWRTKFLLAGAKFNWWCIEVKHYSCFNQLTNDESFICWDSTAKENWVRPMPEFAITSHPLLRARRETYQDFMKRIQADGIVLIGARAAESVQRLYAISQSKKQQEIWPLFDWKDADIWRYIHEKQLDFPETYMYMYQLGSGKRDMRISQFFSIDTSKILVKIGEFYPDLMDRVVKREPNAYLAALYWDSELFRRGKTKETKSKVAHTADNVDYKKKLFDFLADPANVNGEVRKKNIKVARNLIIQFGEDFTNEIYKNLYEAVLAGDPKERSLRAVRLHLRVQRWKRTQNDEEQRVR